MKSRTRFAALVCPLAVAIVAATSAQAEPLQSLGKGEGVLDIIAWPGYIERGESDKQYDWVTQFEKESGCEVRVKTAATSDEMVALMAKGGYDLVTASGDASLRLIYGKRVQPINTALIPNWKNIDPRLKDAPWYVVGQQTDVIKPADLRFIRRRLGMQVEPAPGSHLFPLEYPLATADLVARLAAGW